MAAGILSAEELGILPGVKDADHKRTTEAPDTFSHPNVWSGRQDAALHVRQDARRYDAAELYNRRKSGNLPE